VTELAEKPELVGHSESGGEERAPLIRAWPTLEPGSISLHEAPRAIHRSSVGESLYRSSHFLNIISDYESKTSSHSTKMANLHKTHQSRTKLTKGKAMESHYSKDSLSKYRP